ncbi:unnamed protein product [Arabidopsis thaliana]|uniref:(thale cress) hypothetical protein n=1 Tax=Arabidopsis thaliana TaxID=3702 RepID=A0A7G2FH62_ARATH|nr:unnamed protein product [Arabidopsis thaliana]
MSLFLTKTLHILSQRLSSSSLSRVISNQDRSVSFGLFLGGRRFSHFQNIWFPSDKIYGEFSRILNGTDFVCKHLEGEMQRTIQRRVALAGFLEPQCLYLKSIKLSTFSLSFGAILGL